MKRTRIKFEPEFKSKVALEAIKERSTLLELAEKKLQPKNQVHLIKAETILYFLLDL